MKHLLVAIVCLATILGAADAAPPDRPGRGVRQAAASLGPQVQQAADAIVQQVLAGGDFTAAVAAAEALFDQVIAYAASDDDEAFRTADMTRRLLGQLAHVANDQRRQDLLRYLWNNQRLAEDLAFLVKPGQEKPEEVYALLDELRQARGDALDAYASLAAAICVVHEKPLSRRVNENTATAPPALMLFDYFRANEGRLLFGLRSVPPELMIYVVDSTASIEEMAWALGRYAGDTSVGARFFDIDYDYEHFRTGEQKKVTAAGWSLPNILRFGGVCADQAWFAVTVGKSIGVPTAYVRGASGDVSHAWVGFLQSDGRRGWWNFNTGRYEAYQGVRGIVFDPQTRQAIPDSYVALLADFIHADRAERQLAEATADGAARLMQIERDGQPWPPAPSLEGATTAQRQPTVADQLGLLEAGLRACPGSIESWLVLNALSADGRLTLDDKKRWAGVLDRLCGKWYPDFQFAMLRPMIASVEDVEAQNTMWNAAFRSFQGRADLAAEVRMEQASMWLAAGRPERAGQCYEDVITRYATAGPFMVEALEEATKILRAHDDARRALALHDKAWSLTKKPKEMAAVFSRQSNWFKVGNAYARLLEEVGMAGQAAQVRAALGR